MHSFEVDPGDEIQWCDRWVRVLEVDRYQRTKRTGVLIRVEGEGVTRRSLHYYDDETVLCLRHHAPQETPQPSSPVPKVTKAYLGALERLEAKRG